MEMQPSEINERAAWFLAQGDDDAPILPAEDDDNVADWDSHAPLVDDAFVPADGDAAPPSAWRQWSTDDALERAHWFRDVT